MCIYAVSLTLSSSYIDGIAPPLGRSVMMHLIRSVDSTFNPVWAAGSREVLLPPQPHLIFATTAESGLMASWAHREPRSKRRPKISTWKGSLWEEQQAQSDALIGVSVHSSGEEALGSSLP